MGTLTGTTPSLVDHCPHKLPTSCRLTATKHCCACQDKRPHAPTYSTYVDGVGMVMRGKRWQRYCWFCKEFWENRVAATDPVMDPKETKIPEVPDQTSFLDRWFDYHRGYRLIHNEDGSTERTETMRPERPWLDTSPGDLPLVNDDQRRMTLQWDRSATLAQDTNQVSLDSTLDDLMEAAEGEQQNRQIYLRERPPARERTLQPLNTRQPDLATIRDPGLAPARGTTSQHQPVRQRDLPAIENNIQEIDRRLAAIESTRREAENTVQRIDAELSHVRGIRAELNRELRSAQNMTRVFGTREEIQRQGAEYVSPLTTMFTRAYERYRVAEEVRAQDRASGSDTDRHRHLRETLFAQRRFPFEAARAAQDEIRRGNPAPRSRTLDDVDDDRPAPKTEAEMTVKLVCKICLQQTADTAVLPCGHLVMCSFCADVWAPARKEDHTQPLGRVHCPVCRKRIHKKVKVYTS